MYKTQLEVTQLVISKGSTEISPFLITIYIKASIFSDYEENNLLSLKTNFSKVDILCDFEISTCRSEELKRQILEIFRNYH